MKTAYTKTLLICLNKFEAPETHNGRIDGKKRVHGFWQESNGMTYFNTETIPDDVPLDEVQSGYVLYRDVALAVKL